MGTVSTAGREPIKWTLRRASVEFGVSVPTLVGKLNEAGEVADEDKTFPTRTIVAALFGSQYEERLKKLKAEREHTELETAILRAEFAPVQELTRTLSEVANAMKQIVRASKLDRTEQDDFLRALASIKIVIKDAASRQAHPPAQGRNGDAQKQDGPDPARRSKREPVDSDTESELEADEKTKRKAAATATS